MPLGLHFPTQPLVEEKHDLLIEKYCGLPGVRDGNALGSALARAGNALVYSDGQPKDIFDAAAALAYGIRRSHPFADGNKRAAWLTMQAFLAANHVEVAVDPADAVACMVKLANGELREWELAGWLRKLCAVGGQAVSSTSAAKFCES